jgi:hypothetical protein
LATWAALFRKDFRLTRTVFLVGIVINLLIFMLALFVDRNVNDPVFVFIPLIVAAVFHLFYLPIMLFISLKAEAVQLHLWLHNPRPATSLLLSKIVNALMMMVISLVILYAMSGYLINARFQFIEAYWTDTWNAGLLIFVHLILLALVMGVWIIFLWALYHALKNRIGRWSWLVLFAAVIVPSWLGAVIEDSSPYRLLTQWINWEMNFPTFSIDPIPAYAGEYVYHGLLLVGLFYLSAWIMDRKVEV